MSVTAEVNDIEALTQALGDVRNDGGEGVNRKSWVLVGHVNNNPNQIQLIGQVSCRGAIFRIIPSLQVNKISDCP